MEPDIAQEGIKERITKLNNQLSKSNVDSRDPQIDRDGLLDALTILYEECNIPALRQKDKIVDAFCIKYRGVIRELKRSRVNLMDFEVQKAIGQGQFGVVHVSTYKIKGQTEPTLFNVFHYCERTLSHRCVIAFL